MKIRVFLCFMTLNKGEIINMCKDLKIMSGKIRDVYKLKHKGLAQGMFYYDVEHNADAGFDDMAEIYYNDKLYRILLNLLPAKISSKSFTP